MGRLGILLILLSIGIVFVVAFNILQPFRGTQDKNDARRKDDLQKITQALEAYKVNYGKYPDYDTDTYTIKVNGDDFKWGNSWMPFIEMLPKDPGYFKRYVYWADRVNGLQSYRLYASLDNPIGEGSCGGKDTDCPHVPAAKICGVNAACNFGVTSGNISP